MAELFKRIVPNRFKNQPVLIDHEHPLWAESVAPEDFVAPEVELKGDGSAVPLPPITERPLEEMTKAELLAIAAQLDLDAPARSTNAELVKLIAEHRAPPVQAEE